MPASNQHGAVYGHVAGAVQGYLALVKGRFPSEARAAATQAIIAQADTRARALAPVIAEIRATGVHSYRGIAAQLDTRGIPTARGGHWAQRKCATRAFDRRARADFRARLALMPQESPVLPVEATIAVRRLEEEFCLRFVRCAHSDPNSFRFRASFESCLHNEAMENYEEERKE
jgi:hypothetical protein